MREGQERLARRSGNSKHTIPVKAKTSARWAYIMVALRAPLVVGPRAALTWYGGALPFAARDPGSTTRLVAWQPTAMQYGKIIREVR